jgi:hypothetical protein
MGYKWAGQRSFAKGDTRFERYDLYMAAYAHIHDSLVTPATVPYAGNDTASIRNRRNIIPAVSEDDLPVFRGLVSRKMISEAVSGDWDLWISHFTSMAMLSVPGLEPVVRSVTIPAAVAGLGAHLLCRKWEPTVT